MNRRALAGAILVGAGVVVLTTAPWRFSEAPQWESCVICGSAGGADALLNVLLFVPLGYLLVRAGLPWWVATLIGVAGSAGIEAIQSYQPARYATAGDIATNGLGTLTGAALARWGGRFCRWTDRAGWPGGGVLAAPGAVALLATAWLLQPSLPDSTYYGQWAPDLGQFDRYAGEVVDAAVGRVPVPPGRREDSPAIRRALLGGESVALRVRPAARLPDRPAPVFSIFDDRQREIVFMGVADSTGLVRLRPRAAELRLRWPFVAAPGLVGGAEGAGPVSYRWTRGDRDCLEWSDRRACGLRPPISRGWALVPGSEGGSSATFGDGIWLALLFAPLGCARARRNAIFGAALLIGLAVALPPLAGLGPVPAAAWAVAGALFAVSWLTGRARSARPQTS